jgi:predicted DNA-binding protein (MmcQ/YjbR family)
MEDIFSYKGVNLERMNWGEKLVKLNTLLKKDIKQISYNKSFVVFGLPLMCKTSEELNKKIENENIKYKISSVQFKLFNRVNSHLFMTFKNYSQLKPSFELEEKPANKNVAPVSIQQQQNNHTQDGNKTFIKKQTKKEQVFVVRPDIQDDIYYLFCLNNQLKEEQYGFAHIPDYNTSVMMNKLFRVIKENQNLDALEESDDEEEFENEDIHKFVHLNKSYNMVCVFNYKFKKWVPIKLANKEASIVNINELTP